MLFTGTTLYIGDNSGARKVNIIKVISRSKYRWGRVADVTLSSIKKARPHKKMKKSEKCRVIIINAKNYLNRLGHILKFQINSGIVLKKDDPIPIGSRVHLRVPFEVRPVGFRRLLTMASINI